MHYLCACVSETGDEMRHLTRPVSHLIHLQSVSQFETMDECQQWLKIQDAEKVKRMKMKQVQWPSTQRVSGEGEDEKYIESGWPWNLKCIILNFIINGSFMAFFNHHTWHTIFYFLSFSLFLRVPLKLSTWWHEYGDILITPGWLMTWK